VKLTTHLHLVSRTRMRGATPDSLNTPSWRGAQLKHRVLTNLPWIPHCQSSFRTHVIPVQKSSVLSLRLLCTGTV
jgi:hypothetical protein